MSLHMRCATMSPSKKSLPRGLTPEIHAQLTYAFGEGMCHICFATDKPLHLDHCHVTGDLRGYLCADCNLGLGRFKDDPDRLRRAIQYLGQTGIPPVFVRRGLKKAKLTVDQVRAIKQDRLSSAQQLAARHGVARETINAIRQGRNWKWVE